MVEVIDTDEADAVSGIVSGPKRETPEKGALAQFQLFRPEALADARDRFGAPARVIGLSSASITGFLAALFLCVVASLSVMHYARKETVVGILAPSEGTIQMLAPRHGVIAAVHVRNNQEVAKGERLVTLETETTTRTGARVSALLTTANLDQANSLRLQLSATDRSLGSAREQLRQQRSALGAKLGHLRETIGLTQERLRLAEQTAEASRVLAKRQFLSVIALRQREDAVLIAKRELLDAQVALSEIPSAIAQLDAEERKLVSDTARTSASLSMQLAQLREREVSIGADSSVQLVAPQSGRIGLLHAKVGLAVAAGANIATVVPYGAVLEAELWVPSRAIGFIRRGDRVRLMYDAFPYERFGVTEGRVEQIDRAPTSATELAPNFKTDEPLYRVLVIPSKQYVEAYGRTWPLVPGMRLQADIVLEEQSLLGWMFDQVRAAAKRQES